MSITDRPPSFIFQGEKLKSRRIERGLTQDALAEAAGVFQFSISKIERDQQVDMLASTLIRIAHALEVPAEFFYSLTTTGDQKNGAEQR